MACREVFDLAGRDVSGEVALTGVEAPLLSLLWIGNLGGEATGDINTLNVVAAVCLSDQTDLQVPGKSKLLCRCSPCPKERPLVVKVDVVNNDGPPMSSDCSLNIEMINPKLSGRANWLTDEGST